MLKKIWLAGTGVALILAGCGSEGEPSAEAVADTAAQTMPSETSPEKAAEAPAGVPPGAVIASDGTVLSEDDIIWADEAFLIDAGAKQGKDVIYLPTPPMVIDKMVELAEIKPTDLVYDLGTGDGRIAMGAAKACGCKVVGYEIDTELVRQARENVREAGLEELVTIEEADVLKLDLSAANVILMSFTADLNERLIPQLQKLEPGTRIVAHDYGMNDKIEDEIVIRNFVSKIPDFVNLHTIYKWTAPIKLAQ